MNVQKITLRFWESVSGVAYSIIQFTIPNSRVNIWSSSSSVRATTLGGFWPALRFRSTFFYLYTCLSSFSLSSSLIPLLLGQAISILVFLLLLMNMVPIQVSFLTVLVVSILITCAAQRNLHCDFINLTIFFS